MLHLWYLRHRVQIVLQCVSIALISVFLAGCMQPLHRNDQVAEQVLLTCSTMAEAIDEWEGIRDDATEHARSTTDLAIARQLYLQAGDAQQRIIWLREQYRVCVR